VLQKDLGGRRVRATGQDELDGGVEVGLRVGDLLGQRKRVPGLDQHVQTPRLDLLAFRLWVFDRLCHRAARFRLYLDEPCLGKLELKLISRRLSSLRPSGELVEAAGELVQARVEHGTLGLGVGGDLLQTDSEARLDLLRALLERLQRFVALPVERAAEL
jgi:hypothetical protein